MRLRPARAGRPRRGRRRPARRHERARSGDHGACGDPVRAVIAEDSVLMREGLTRLLTEAGIEIVGQAGDGEDLLRKTRAHKPDVVVTDIRMPPTQTDEGLRAARTIRDELPQT